LDEQPHPFVLPIDAARALSTPNNAYVLKDSGAREEFLTGSRRDTRQDKGRYDLLSPLALRRIALIYERGAVKYGDRNWEKGQPIMRYLDSALRHIFNHIEGERDEDHLSQAAWNLIGALHTEESITRNLLPPELDDRPDFTKARRG
jgi:hypothetical protein